MKVHLGQINTTPLDFKGNTEKHVDGYLTAVADKCDIAVFPELGIPGYLCADSIYSKNFVRKNKECLKRLMEITESSDTYLVVGYVDENNTGSGKKFRNMLAVIQRGQIIGTYQKWLLPFYDVFDEPRYFAPGKDLLVLNIAGKKVGFTICEDIWNDKGQDDYNHLENPVQKYKDIGTQILVNISSSPYAKGKPQTRHHIVNEVSRDFEALIYVNQYGAQDELVFDGRSSVFIRGASSICIEPQTDPRTQYKVSATINGSLFPYSRITFENDHLKMALLGLYDYATKCNFKHFVVGSSGGIDSAVVLAMAATVFPPENVHGIMMPGPYSSGRSVNDATLLHKNLGIKSYIRPIDVSMDMKKNDDLITAFNNINPVTGENIQARARGQVVMHFANAVNGLPFVTANKTESALGYSTLFGDLAGCFAPIGDLYKLEVYQLARDLNAYYGREVIPRGIIDAAPSAELAPNQTDEASLAPYTILDPLVKSYVEDYVDNISCFEKWIKGNISGDGQDIILNWLDLNPDKYIKLIKRIEIMEFKRRLSPLCPKLTVKSFGTGRRIPIVRG